MARGFLELPAEIRNEIIMQSAHFNLTIGSTPDTFEPPSEVADVDTEAQELQDMLYNIRKQAQSLLDTIVAVRLGLVMRELPRSWRHGQLIEQRLPSITFIFEEHTSAHDLNHESALAWKQWLEDSGASGLQKWQLRAEAQTDVKEPQDALQSAGRTHNNYASHLTS
ncbi:hypothetical protein EJ07DRAFT_156798 [Lizonia empirigonia]|nr:hypothetical protein EJ07DRAFT_156798 [Lizonia empirigonia]